MPIVTNISANTEPGRTVADFGASLDVSANLPGVNLTREGRRYECPVCRKPAVWWKFWSCCRLDTDRAAAGEVFVPLQVGPSGWGALSNGQEHGLRPQIGFRMSLYIRAGDEGVGARDRRRS